MKQINPFFLNFLKTMLILSVLFFSTAYAQSDGSHDKKTDSLAALIKIDLPDTNKVIHLNALGWELMYVNPDTAILLSNQALKLATLIAGSSSATKNSSIKTRAEKGIAQSNSNLGAYYWLTSEYALSISYHLKALEKRKTINDKPGIASSFNNIGIVYYSQGDYPKALEHYFNALKINDELGDKNEIATNLGNIGTVYSEQGDYLKAKEYYISALHINEEIGNKEEVARNLQNIGTAYHYLKNSIKALEYFFKALKINEELDNKYDIAVNLGNIGEVYYLDQGDNSKGLDYYFKSLKINEDIGEKRLLAFNFGHIGTIYINEKKYKEGEEYLLKALKISTEIGELSLMKDHCNTLSDLYSKTNRYQLAYEHYKQYSIVKDNLFNEDKSKDIGRLEMQHEMEMADIESERIKNEEFKTRTQKRERRNLLQYSGMAIGLLIIGLLVAMLGFIKLNPWMAEGITFFAFLLFFEFILVLLDPYMDKYSGGEPVYKLGFNAVVAACIFPLHAFFERMLKKRLMKK